MASPTEQLDYDFIVIGSGFGGSVSALRLIEKGYSVLVLEKGKRLAAEDFPKTNWQMNRWLWLPALRFFGLFKMTFFRHIAILSGVGVGGGSLVYANTLPVPKPEFFHAPSWASLADWQAELEPFYPLALKMLGATPNPRFEIGDQVLRKVAEEIGKPDQVEAPDVAVFFGEPEQTVPDPFFDGLGPDRAGCTFCGGCMLGCRYNAKNTLDKNYLYLAELNGAHIQPESEVYGIQPLRAADGQDGYRVHWKTSTRLFPPKGAATARGIVFAGGVLGSVELMLNLRKSSLPRLSPKVGSGVRTNSESLMGVTTLDKEIVFSDGIAIGSILNTDVHSHLEPVRYSAGSGAWRLLQSSMVLGKNIWVRLGKLLASFVREPVRSLRVFFIDDWAKRTQILLYMRTLDSTLRFSRGRFGLRSSMEQGEAPSAFNPKAQELADKFARHVDGKTRVLFTESLFGIPTTAHILGGSVMGETPEDGVIDKDQRVFGYKNMYVCDGSAISANPGVNPSLTITALSERVMSKIPNKQDNPSFHNRGKYAR